MDAAGKMYVFDCFLARLRRERKAMAFRSYVADALQILTENTAKREERRYLAIRYADLLAEKPEKEDGRTAEEIVFHIKEGLERLRG